MGCDGGQEESRHDVVEYLVEEGAMYGQCYRIGKPKDRLVCLGKTSLMGVF